MAREITTDRFLIADVADLTGVPAPRLRSWERSGLLHPRRSAGDVRVYGVEDVARARLIARSLINPGRRGSLRRIAGELASGALRPDSVDYAGLRPGTRDLGDPSPGGNWTVIDALPDLVAVWDEAGGLVNANRALRAALGLLDQPATESRETTIAATLLGSGALAPRWTAQTGVAQDDVPLTLSIASGPPLQTRWRTVPLRGPDGRPRGAVTIGRDVTEAESQFRVREERLAAAASDLRAPAGVVLGNLQLARRTLATLRSELTPAVTPRQPGRDRLARHLAMAEAGTRELLRALDTLLDATMAATGGLIGDLTPEPVDLVAIATEAITHAQTLTARHQFRLNDAPSRPIVTGDRDRLRELLDNLLANAVTFAPEGGTVEIALTRACDDDHLPLPESPTGAWCIVRVSDQGIGIADTDVPHVFDRYFRGSNAATFVRGAGLGLYAVQAIATSHGGHAWIKRTATANDGSNGVTPGTTVAVALPCRPPSPAADDRSGDQAGMLNGA